MVVTPAERMAAQLGREARERFVLQMCRAMVGIAGTVQGTFTSLMGQSGTTTEMQLRRDSWTQFQIEGDKWREATTKLPIEQTGAKMRAMMPWIAKNKLVDQSKN